MRSDPQLHEVAALARRSLEPGLPCDSRGAAVSSGACLHAALVFLLLWRRFGQGAARVRGGAPPAAGCLNQAGALCGHYWVEVDTPDGEAFVVDLTADQFGYEPVVVMPLALASRSYRPGPQQEVDEALDDLALEFGCRDLLAA